MKQGKPLPHITTRLNSCDPEPTRVPECECITVAELSLSLDGKLTESIEGSVMDGLYMSRLLNDRDGLLQAEKRDHEWFLKQFIPYCRRLGFNPYTQDWLTPGCTLE